MWLSTWRSAAWSGDLLSPGVATVGSILTRCWRSALGSSSAALLVPAAAAVGAVAVASLAWALTSVGIVDCFGGSVALFVLSVEQQQ